MASYEEVLAKYGSLDVSPVTGSMKPLIRPGRDSVRLVPVRRPLKPLDVVLYHTKEQIVLHRLIRRTAEGWIIRGDNSGEDETVAEGQIIAVLEGIHRGTRFIPARSLRFRLCSRAMLLAHPLVRAYHSSTGLFWRTARNIHNRTGPFSPGPK